MKPSIYEIPVPAKGRLYIMPKPSGQWLDDDISYISTLGVTDVVSLLTQKEIVELALNDEAGVCEHNNIRFNNLPIEDRALPDLITFAPLVSSLHDYLNDGAGVAIHCRAGIGRAGVLASCILQLFGMDADEAIDTVSEARRVRIPDTQEQIEFVKNFPD